ncbi:MAG: hypothetical protein WD226_14630 [Planctomycetota bacterium]
MTLANVFHVQDHADSPTLDSFAADSLDWPAVRQLFEPFSPSAFGRSALLGLQPRADQDATEAIARAREAIDLVAGGGQPPTAGAVDPRPALEATLEYGRSLDGEALFAVGRLLRLAVEVEHWLLARRDTVPALARLWEARPETDGLLEVLERSLDRRGHVADDATERLSSLRKQTVKLAREIERTLKELAQKSSLKTALSEGHVGQVHRRGGRLCLAVRARSAGQVPGLVHDRSQTGETLFIEPRQVVERANQLAGLEIDERNEVARILADLTKRVVERRVDVVEVARRVDELELALIAAHAAHAWDGRMARLPGEPGAGAGLLLREMRHPLLLANRARGELAEVVPLDLRLGEDFALLLITGPNTGGKTLALKSAGLAVLLTRLALPIPCREGTTVPLWSGIVADIGDEQQIEQNLSTFASHLARIQAGLPRAGPNTLFLLDELGGGTDPTEGAALGDALLQHLLEQGAPTLASTHLGKLKEFAFRFPNAENAHVEFDLETLEPRYALRIGAPGRSRALVIAARLGLPARLVEAASARLERRAGEAEALMESMQVTRLEAEDLRREASRRLEEVERRVAELAEESRAIEERREQLAAEAQRGIEERVTRARSHAQNLADLLPQVPAEARARLAAELARLLEALDEATLTERRKDFLGGLKKGDLVWVPRLKKRCRVKRLRREDCTLEIELGKHRMQLDFDDVTFYEAL